MRNRIRTDHYVRLHWLLTFCHAGALTSIVLFMTGVTPNMSSPGFGFALMGLIFGLVPLAAVPIQARLEMRQLRREVARERAANAAQEGPDW